MRLWIDTDVGTNPDDSFALLCAAGHPAVEVVGVSTVDGDVEARAAVACSLVSAPVVAGSELTPERVAAAELDALLAIGPLTNVARLLEACVLPGRVAVMGGALGGVRHRGSVHEIEHNFRRDAAAAQAVVEGAPDLLVCLLDVTARMRVPPDLLGRFVDTAPVLADAADGWVATQLAAGVPEDEAVVCLHDPLALLALLGEPVVTVGRARVGVDGDGRVSERGDARVCDLVTDVDVNAALARMLELVALARVPSQ